MIIVPLSPRAFAVGPGPTASGALLETCALHDVSDFFYLWFGHSSGEGLNCSLIRSPHSCNVTSGCAYDHYAHACHKIGENLPFFIVNDGLTGDNLPCRLYQDTPDDCPTVSTRCTYEYFGGNEGYCGVTGLPLLTLFSMMMCRGGGHLRAS